MLFSPDGKRLLTASRGGETRLWDTATGEQLAVLQGYEGQVTSTAFSPDGLQILAAFEDGTVGLWDGMTGGAHPALSQGHVAPVISASFSPDGRYIVTGSEDGTARLWDADSRQPKKVFEDAGWVFAEFSPDGTRILTMVYEGRARLWDMETGTNWTVLEQDNNWQPSILFNPNGKGLFVFDPHANTYRLLDIETGDEITALRGHDGRLVDASFSPDGTQIATVSQQTLHLWDVVTGDALATQRLDEGGFESAVFSPDGKQVLTIVDDGTVRMWDAQRRGNGFIDGEFLTARFTPDGKKIITTSLDRIPKVWDAESGDSLAILSEDDRHLHEYGLIDDIIAGPNGQLLMTVESGIFVGDGRQVLGLLENGAQLLWNWLTDEDPAQAHENTTQVAFGGYSPDGGTILTVLENNEIVLWDSATGEKLVNFQRECLKLCVSDRAHAVFRYIQASKRPANIMAS